MPSDSSTICGYALSDVRRSLRDAIDRRDARAAKRWSAELVVTPGAVGSLWASYWLAWASAQGVPIIPILLRQTWETITITAKEYMDTGDGWPVFRNDHQIRAVVGEMTSRLLSQPRQTPVVWPSKEIVLYDVGNMRDTPPPAATDSPVVMRVWQRDADSMDLRMMAGRFLDSLERGDIRSALSAVAWTLLPAAHKGPVSERGPATAKNQKERTSPIWFWLDIGKALLLSRGPAGLHRGWLTMHNAVAEAFALHFRRWSSADRMRMLLAWILQLRATWVAEPAGMWVADSVQQTAAEVDLPYKEIAAELADPQAVIHITPSPVVPTVTEAKQQTKERMESKIAEADAAIMAVFGL